LCLLVVSQFAGVKIFPLVQQYRSAVGCDDSISYIGIKSLQFKVVLSRRGSEEKKEKKKERLSHQ
jgi:hypothetical protein